MRKSPYVLQNMARMAPNISIHHIPKNTLPISKGIQLESTSNSISKHCQGCRLQPKTIRYCELCSQFTCIQCLRECTRCSFYVCPMDLNYVNEVPICRKCKEQGQ